VALLNQAAERDEPQDDDRNRRTEQRAPRQRDGGGPQAPGVLRARDQDRRDASRQRGRNQDGERKPTLRLAVGEGPVEGLYRPQVPGDQGGHRRGEEHEGGAAELRARRAKEHERQEAGDQGAVSPAREREVEAGAERGGRHHGARPQRDGAGRVAREARAQHHPHRRQRAHRVPVGERLLEPSRRAEAALEVEDAREQPLRQPVGHDDRRAHRQGGLDRRERRPAAEERRRAHEHREVHHEPLEVPVGVLADRRPRDRDAHPGHQQRHPGDRYPAASRPGQHARRDERRERGDRGGGDPGRQPRSLEVAAREEGERRRTREQHHDCERR